MPQAACASSSQSPCHASLVHPERDCYSSIDSRMKTNGAPLCGSAPLKLSARALLLRQLLHPDIPEAHRAVISLQEERAGLVHIPVELAAGGAVALHVIVHLLAIDRDGDLVADHSGFHCIP